MSKTLKTDDQRAYLASVLPQNATGFELLYRGSAHGWNTSHFHSRCDGKGRTVTIFESEVGYLAAGYTSIPWSSGGGGKEDSSAFLCALTNKMQLFKPGDQKYAVYHFINAGPYWQELGAWGSPMNAIDSGLCSTNGVYRIPKDG